MRVGRGSLPRALAMGAAIGVAVPLLGQFAPPFHTATHELVQLLTLVAAGFAWVHAARGARLGGLGDRAAPPSARIEGALRTTLAALAALGLAAWATLVAADGLRCGCRLQDGAAFFWTTWPPIALLTAVLGVAAGARGWGWRRLALGALAALILTLIHDGLQAVFGFRVVDLLVGKPLAFDQRADPLPVPLVHLAQRLFVLGLAWAAWCWIRWRAAVAEATWAPVLESEARRRAFPAFASALGMAAIAAFAGGRFGVGCGRSALEAHLSEELRTEHFVLRCVPGGRASMELPAIAREAEWHLHRYEQDWGVDPRSPLTLYIFDDRADLGAWTDAPATHVVFRRVYATWWVAIGPTLYHELAHALHAELRPAPTVLLSRGLLEGLAVAWEDDYARLPEAHAVAAGALRAGDLPSARELMSPFGFFTLDEDNAYTASGSFLGFLILEYGFERLVALQRDPWLSFEAAYGEDLDALDAAWRAFLEGVPVDLDRQVEARDRFDPDLWPSYTERCCPKLGQKVPPLLEQAEMRWEADDWRGALEDYRAIWEERRSPRAAYQAAQCLRWIDRPDEALALLEAALEQPDLADDERFRLRQGRQACLMELQRWPTLAEELAEPPPRDRLPSKDHIRLTALLRQETLRPAVAQVLLAQDPGRRRVLAEALVAAHPEEEGLRYLHATRVFEDLVQAWGLGIKPVERERARDALAHAAQAPGAVDELADEWVALIDKAVRARDLDFAEQVAAEALPLAEEPRVRLALRTRLDRVAWERAGGAGLP